MHGRVLAPTAPPPMAPRGYGEPATALQIVATPIAAQAAPIPMASSRNRLSRSNAAVAAGGDLSASA